MKFSFYIASCLYMVAKHMPPSYSRLKLGQRKIRGWCASKIMQSSGKNVNIEKGAVFSRNCSLGDNSGIGINCEINGTCIIGENVMMGPNCSFFTVNHKSDDVLIPMNQQGETEERAIIVGDDVWIGAYSIILLGVKIGSHYIVGAGSVVTKDVPEYSIVAGNPAEIKKSRK